MSIRPRERLEDMAPLQLRHFCVNRLSKRTLFYQVVGRWLCDTAYSLLFPKTVVRGISVKCIRVCGTKSLSSSSFALSALWLRTCQVNAHTINVGTRSLHPHFWTSAGAAICASCAESTSLFALSTRIRAKSPPAHSSFANHSA